MAVVVALLVLAFVVSRSCQESQIKVTQEEAVALATEQVDFEPDRTPRSACCARGSTAQPFWFVSLSIVDARGQDLVDHARRC